MIVSKTPLRCSFFGGGTDFKEYYDYSKFGCGKTISCALDMNVYITVNKSFDGMIRLCYSDNERVATVDEVRHNIIREAMKKTGVTSGVEIIYSADIPLSSAGIGLASSSALSVGVLNALYTYKGVRKSRSELAKEACEIEIDRLGQHIGIQDQYACSYGGFRTYSFYHGDRVGAQPVLCSPETVDALANHLMLFFTGKTRDSSKILKEQSSTIQSKMEMLDNMVELVDRSTEALSSGDIDIWGTLLDEAWGYKKAYASGVSNPDIDGMYSAAKEAGALGGKILGAGGGGFLLLYVPLDRQAAVRRALAGLREVSFSFNPEGTQIVFMD